MQSEKKYVNKILKKERTIKKAIKKLAKKINADYYESEKEVVFIIVAKGGMFYGIDLLKWINFDCAIEILYSSSYNLKEKIQKPEIHFHKTLNLKNRRLIILDDIIDTGETIDFIIKYLKKYRPADIAVASLFVSENQKIINNKIYYCWKKSPNDFLIGYGFDYDEKFRNLKFIATLR